MTEEKRSLRPVDAFSSMFAQYLEQSGGHLVVGNFVLLRNILKEGLKESYLSPEDEDKLRLAEELWDTVNKGCGCTKNKRLRAAEEAVSNLIKSEAGQAMLNKLKTGFSLESIEVDIPTLSVPVKCRV